MFRTLLPEEVAQFSKNAQEYLADFRTRLERTPGDSRIAQFLRYLDSEAEVYSGLTAIADGLQATLFFLGPHLRPLLGLAVAIRTPIFLVGLHPNNTSYFDYLQSIEVDCQAIDPLSSTGAEATGLAAATFVLDPADLNDELKTFITQVAARVSGRRINMILSGRTVHAQRKLKEIGSKGQYEVVALPGTDNFMQLGLEVASLDGLLSELGSSEGLFLERELGALISEDIVDVKLLARAAARLAIVDPLANLEVIPKARPMFATSRLAVDQVVANLRQSSLLARFFFDLHPSRNSADALRDFCLYADRIAIDGRIETLKLARSNGYCGIRPKIWSEQEFYDVLYLVEGYAEQTGEPESKSPYVFQDTGGIAFAHEARQHIAAKIVEYVIRTIHVQKRPAKIRWLDIGCGSGTTIHLTLNSLRNSTGLVVEAVGVDSSAKAINAARHHDQPSARFICGNAFELSDAEEAFDVVTMFEFLEHLPDPVEFIKTASQLTNAFVIGGSPLDEPLTGTQSLAHLYSFSGDGFASLFTAAGLSVVMLNQTKIGSYENDHDWVTCVASKRGIKLSDR